MLYWLQSSQKADDVKGKSEDYKEEGFALAQLARPQVGLALTLAVGVATQIGRLLADVHWFSDVIGGAPHSLRAKSVRSRQQLYARAEATIRAGPNMHSCCLALLAICFLEIHQHHHASQETIPDHSA